MARSLLIDASSHIHRDWHVMKDADQTVRCFSRRMEAFEERFRPDRFVVCFDSSQSFRKALDSGYKSKRTEKEASLVESLEQCRSEVIQLGFDSVDASGFEADDLIATLTQQDQRRRWQTVISSTDKDLRQLLVDGEVTLMTSWAKEINGPIHFEWLTAKGLLQKHGFTPAQWLEYQILFGDPGDGVKGCPGIGEVTAKKLVLSHGLEALLKNPWLIPQEAIRRKFMQWVKTIDTARQLVELRKDVPLPEYWGVEVG